MQSDSYRWSYRLIRTAETILRRKRSNTTRKKWTGRTDQIYKIVKTGHIEVEYENYIANHHAENGFLCGTGIISIFADSGRCADCEAHRTGCAAGVVVADRRHVLSGKCDDAGDRNWVCKNGLYPHVRDNCRDPVVCDIPTNDCGTFVGNGNDSRCRSNRRSFCYQKIFVLYHS